MGKVSSEHSIDKRPIHLVQASLFSTLLRQDSKRRWRSLVAAWARWTYDDKYPWLSERFGFDGWMAYVYNFLSGARPFPWPDEYTLEDRLKANLALLHFTIQWVAADEPERAAIACGMHGMLAEAHGPATPSRLLCILARATAESGDVARAIHDALVETGDGGQEITKNELERIEIELDEHMAAIATLRATVAQIRREEE